MSLPAAACAGVALAMAKAHEGIETTGTKVLKAPCMRNALALVGRQRRRVVPAFVAAHLCQDDVETTWMQWRRIAVELRPISLPRTRQSRIPPTHRMGQR